MTCIHILVAAIHHAKKSAQRRRNFITSVFAIAAGDDEG
jgi:hypothetical protein